MFGFSPVNQLSQKPVNEKRPYKAPKVANNFVNGVNRQLALSCGVVHEPCG